MAYTWIPFYNELIRKENKARQFYKIKRSMATLFEYKCKKCGYTKSAHPKGHDMIMSGDLYTYLCEDCKEVVDVLYPYGGEA